MIGRGSILPRAEHQACHGPWHNQGGANPFPSSRPPTAMDAAATRSAQHHGVGGSLIAHPRGFRAEPPSPMLLQLVTAIKLIPVLGLCSESACSKAGSDLGAGAGGICALGLYVSSVGWQGLNPAPALREQAGNRPVQEQSQQKRGFGRRGGPCPAGCPMGRHKAPTHPMEHRPVGQRGHPAPACAAGSAGTQM